MSTAYRQQLTTQILEREEERSALVEALLSGRMTGRHSLWEAADLLRLPTSGPYVVVAAELPAIGRLGLPAIENKLSARDIRSAWRLLPDLQVGIVHLRDPAPSGTLGTLVEVLRQAATARVGISPPFHELSETSDALRFARVAVTGKPSGESLVTVFDDTPLAVAAVSAPEVMAKIKSVAAAPARRTARRGTHCPARHLPGVAGGRRLCQRHRDARSIAIPIPCGTGCAASRS